VLVVDSARGQLITCGSIFQGTCETRSLANVSTITGTYRSDTSQFIASSDSSVPTVAFISPGPNGVDYLYVGTVDLGPGGTLNIVYNSFRQFTCGASSRILTDRNQLFRPNIDIAQGTYSTYVKFISGLATPIVVTYVAGFGLNGFSYFLTTQPDGPGTTTLLSRIARVCQADNSYSSFVDMTIVCRSGNRNYNVLRSAVVRQPGSVLASSLGIGRSDYVLLATFYGMSDSALCVYKMNDIQSGFTVNLQLCFNASGSPRGPQYNNPLNIKCSPQVGLICVLKQFSGHGFVSRFSLAGCLIRFGSAEAKNLLRCIPSIYYWIKSRSEGRLIKHVSYSLRVH